MSPELLEQNKEASNKQKTGTIEIVIQRNKLCIEISTTEIMTGPELQEGRIDKKIKHTALQSTSLNSCKPFWDIYPNENKKPRNPFLKCLKCSKHSQWLLRNRFRGGIGEGMGTLTNKIRGWHSFFLCGKIRINHAFLKVLMTFELRSGKGIAEEKQTAYTTTRRLDPNPWGIVGTGWTHRRVWAQTGPQGQWAGEGIRVPMCESRTQSPLGWEFGNQPP